MKKQMFYFLFFILNFATLSMAEEKVSKDIEIEKEDESLQMDDINLTDGCNPSPYVSGCTGGGLKHRREKLEERNKKMVDKKIEEIRLKQEKALANKLEDSFKEKTNSSK